MNHASDCSKSALPSQHRIKSGYIPRTVTESNSLHFTTSWAWTSIAFLWCRCAVAWKGMSYLCHPLSFRRRPVSHGTGPCSHRKQASHPAAHKVPKPCPWCSSAHRLLSDCWAGLLSFQTLMLAPGSLSPIIRALVSSQLVLYHRYPFHSLAVITQITLLSNHPPILPTYSSILPSMHISYHMVPSADGPMAHSCKPLWTWVVHSAIF